MRKTFLHQHWISYPKSLGLMPRGRILSGRLENFEEDFSHWSVHPSQFLAKDILQNGDWIELDVKNEKVHLLAPNLLGAFQQSDKVQTLKHWNVFLKTVREYFESQNFMEIQTPTLVNCPGTEPSLDVFSVEYVHGSHKQKMFLPTSPELHLKKALAQGFERIFEIKSCFRNNELSPTHQPEFFMLEWYQSFADLSVIQGQLIGLIEYVQSKMQFQNVFIKPQKITMSEVWKKFFSFDLTAKTTLEDLQKLAKQLEIPLEDNWDDQFFRIYVEKIEPYLQKEPFFLEKYPPSQAALARLTEDGWGDRFEFYWQGIELANAFNELNDPEVQKQRFAQDLEEKKRLGKEAITLDADFEKALLSGLPPSSGIALGLERLFMVLTGTHDISDLRLFPME